MPWLCRSATSLPRRRPSTSARARRSASREVEPTRRRRCAVALTGSTGRPGRPAGAAAEHLDGHQAVAGGRLRRERRSAPWWSGRRRARAVPSAAPGAPPAVSSPATRRVSAERLAAGVAHADADAGGLRWREHQLGRVELDVQGGGHPTDPGGLGAWRRLRRCRRGRRRVRRGVRWRAGWCRRGRVDVGAAAVGAAADVGGAVLMSKSMFGVRSAGADRRMLRRRLDLAVDVQRRRCTGRRECPARRSCRRRRCAPWRSAGRTGTAGRRSGAGRCAAPRRRTAVR